MLSSIRTAVKHSSRKVSVGYAGYATSAADSLMNELERPSGGPPGPPTAVDGYSRMPALPSSPSSAKFPASTTSAPSIITPYKLHCQSTATNTIVTFTDPSGNPVAWASGGSCGFKRGQRASYEAGYQCAVKIFKVIENIMAQPEKIVRISLCFKNFGMGREAMQKALMTSEGGNVRGLIDTVTDRTAIKIGGTRAKKARRM